MTDLERHTAAARFAKDWKDRDDEKQKTSHLPSEEERNCKKPGYIY